VADDLAFADLGVEPDSGDAEVEIQEDAADDTDAGADAESDVAQADAQEDEQVADAGADSAADLAGPDGGGDAGSVDGVGVQDVSTQADAGNNKARGAADGCTAARTPAAAWPFLVVAGLLLAMRRRSWHKAARRA
jgi:hypothetical protein